jgi:hypothetical protein
MLCRKKLKKFIQIESGRIYDIPFEDLYEYIELVGYLTIKNPITC